MLFGDGIRDDTANVQRLLDGRGEVFIGDGTYLISSPLIIHDDTTLRLTNGAVMKLADNSNCAIIENDTLPTRGTNYNISLIGGIWDGNNENQVRRSRASRFELTCYEEDYYYGILMRFVGVENFHMAHLTVRNPESYAMLICNVDNFTVEHITFDQNMLRTNMDGVHIQGKARNGRICDIKGATNDDLVAINCDDTYACEITRGDIENIAIENLYSDNGYTAVRLLSCGSKMKNVSIRNIFGTYRYYGVSFTHHKIHPGEPIWFDNISVSDVFASKPIGDKSDRPIIWFAKGISCGNVSISNVHRIEEDDTIAPTIRIDEDVTIDRLIVSDVTQKFLNCPEIPVIVNNGTVKKLILRDVEGQE